LYIHPSPFLSALMGLDAKPQAVGVVGVCS
jgi:hypothetical protein